MNDIPPAPASDPPAPRPPADAPPSRFGRRRALLTLLSVAVALVVAYAILEMRREARTQQQLAQLRAEEAAEASARAAAAELQAQQALKRLAEYEQAAAEVAGEPAIAGRGDEVLLEVERLLTLAMHDLQLSRQTATALAALELADARLAAGGAARWAALRRALARDIDRLRAVPVVDTVGIAVRLDQLIAAVDGLPTVNAPAPPARPAPRPAPKKADPPPLPEPAPPPGAWDKVRAWLDAEFGELVRIQKVGAPEALLLDAEQERLVRQQLKLRLLGARTALLARSERPFQGDVDAALALLGQYFDARSAPVGNAMTTLRQLRGTALLHDVPALADSQTALRAARAQRP